MSPRILVIRFSSMGDILLTTPVLRALREKYPQGEIHFLTKAKFREAIETHPVPDQFWYLENSLHEIIRQLQQVRFDIVIDLHASMRSALVRFQLNGDHFIFPKKSLKRWLWMKYRIGKPDSRHIVERYMAALKPLGIISSAGKLEFNIHSEVLNRVVLEKKQHFQQNPVAIVLAATWNTKKWPEEHFIRFLKGLNRSFVLLGGPGEQAMGDRILQETQGGINLCGHCTLQESAAWIEQAPFVITHDTGLMHLAAALQKTCFVIWGNTTPELGMYPWKTEFYNLEVRGLECRPCTHLGHAVCPKGHFACMRNNDPDKLLGMVNFSISG
jgi:ADP-heptose:LPS heptosyltransferase